MTTTMVAEMPRPAEAAVIGTEPPVGMAPVAGEGSRLPPGRVGHLGGSAPLPERQVPVDQLVVVGGDHGQMVGPPSASSGVTARSPGRPPTGRFEAVPREDKWDRVVFVGRRRNR